MSEKLPEVLDAPKAEAKQAIVQVKRDIERFDTASYDDLRRMAAEMCVSELLPAHLVKKPANLLLVLMTGQELGIGALQAIDSVDVIQGKRSIKPEAQLALIKSKCPGAHVSFKQDAKAKTFSCTMAPSKDRMDEAFTAEWDMERAKEMGLTGKDNWKKQPLTMLKWRAIGEAARTVFPHVTKGIYNSEEALDLDRNVPERKAPSLKSLFVESNEKADGRSEPEALDVPAAEPSGLEVEEVENGE